MLFSKKETKPDQLGFNHGQPELLKKPAVRMPSDRLLNEMALDTEKAETRNHGALYL